MADKKAEGLHRKYSVKRLKDRVGKHDNCDYFVLDWLHDKFAYVAIRAYADACEAEYPQLTSELRTKASRWASHHAIDGRVMAIASKA